MSKWLEIPTLCDTVSHITPLGGQPAMVKRRRTLWLLGALLGTAWVTGAILLAGAHFWFHSERRAFQQRVQVGMSAAELLEAVGKPNQELKPGDTLARWGSAAERVVAEPTWVYFVTPGSQHRFVLTLRDVQIVHVEYAGN